MTTASWNRRTEAQTIASSTLAQLSPLWLRGRRRFLTLCKGASGLGSHPVRAHASSNAEGFSPFHSAGGPPVTSILPARPPMRGREKKRHMWPWQTSIHVDAWRKAEPSQDIVTGAKEQRSNTAPVQTHNRRRCSSTWRRSPGSCTACVSKSQYSILNTQYSVLGTFEGPTSRLCWDLRPSSRTQQPCG